MGNIDPINESAQAWLTMLILSLVNVGQSPLSVLKTNNSGIKTVTKTIYILSSIHIKVMF